jgi:CO dehydrogenase/acetyl-CoA synthase alpha subunit
VKQPIGNHAIELDLAIFAARLGVRDVGGRLIGKIVVGGVIVGVLAVVGEENAAPVYNKISKTVEVATTSLVVVEVVGVVVVEGETITTVVVLVLVVVLVADCVCYS